MAAIVEASVWLWRELRGALVVQEELIEAGYGLLGLVGQQLRRNGRRRETHSFGSALSATASKRREAKNSQRSLQKPSRRAMPEAEDLHLEYRHTSPVSRHFRHDQPRKM